LAESTAHAQVWTVACGEAICDRGDYTAFMYLGQVVEYGPTARLFTNPLLKETEDYITGRFG